MFCCGFRIYIVITARWSILFIFVFPPSPSSLFPVFLGTNRIIFPSLVCPHPALLSSHLILRLSSCTIDSTEGQQLFHFLMRLIFVYFYRIFSSIRKPPPCSSPRIPLYFLFNPWALELFHFCHLALPIVILWWLLDLRSFPTGPYTLFNDFSTANSHIEVNSWFIWHL